MDVHHRIHNSPPIRRPCVTIRNKLCGVIARLPNIQAGYYPLSAVADCLFDIVYDTLRIWSTSPLSTTQFHLFLVIL